MLARAVACLFLLQIFAFVFSLNERAVASNSPQDAALSMAGELCDADEHDEGEAPARHHHHQHCALCGVGNRAAPLDAVAFTATIVALVLPQSYAAPTWIRRDELKPSLAGWASSWSSRAPPLFS